MGRLVRKGQIHKRETFLFFDYKEKINMKEPYEGLYEGPNQAHVINGCARERYRQYRWDSITNKRKQIVLICINRKASGTNRENTNVTFMTQESKECDYTLVACKVDSSPRRPRHTRSTQLGIVDGMGRTLVQTEERRKI
jgi:predicted Fe-S protein YdhL (DUF1289 family)